jgi:hypothetical protein
MLTGYPPLIEIFVVLALTAVFLWALAAIPGDATIKGIIRMVAIIIVCIYVIFFLASLATGLLHSGGIPVRRGP